MGNLQFLVVRNVQLGCSNLFVSPHNLRGLRVLSECDVKKNRKKKEEKVMGMVL